MQENNVIAELFYYFIFMIGERLKLFGNYIGSLKLLADKLNMKPQALHSYLKNNRLPGAGILIKLYNLNCNINWLLTGEGEMLINNNSHNINTNNAIAELYSNNLKLNKKIKLLEIQNDTLAEKIQTLKKGASEEPIIHNTYPIPAEELNG